MMVNMWPYCLDGVKPHAVNEIEIARHESGRVCSEVERICPAAAMADNEPKFRFRRLVGALPCVAEQTRLIGCRKGVGFSNVNLRRVELERGPNDSIEHVLRRHNKQPDRFGVAFGERHNLREQVSLSSSRWCAVSSVIVHIN